MLTEGNIKRLVSKLTKMRGAALKLGQFMSIQGIVSRLSFSIFVLIHVKIATCSLQKLRISSGEFKIVPTTCQTGRWK